jgi:cobalt/nickel transport system ATP-binding protein
MLEIHDLQVKYQDGHQVLDGLKLSIADGETVGLVGENGAGKSTLFLSLLGILYPSNGSITVNGVELNKNNIHKIREQIGLVFQNPDDQLFMSNVYDDIAFGLRNHGLTEDCIRQRIQGIAQELDIEKLLQLSSSKLSGGEKRIIAIATILVMEPSIVLFDEPSSFLDPKARRRLIQLLKGLSMTKLIATHDLDMALELCDRVLILKDGKIFAEGKAQEILTNQALLTEAGLELPFCLQGPMNIHAAGAKAFQIKCDIEKAKLL